MKKITIYLNKWPLLIACCLYTILSLCSCKKFIDIAPAPNIISTTEIFSNDAAAISAVSGLYAKLRSSTTILTNGGTSLYCALSADELYSPTLNSLADPFYKNTVPANNSTIAFNFWSSAYSNIYVTNAIIEGLTKSTTMTDSIKKQLVGEVKVIRALHYFYLVNLFGDVPLVVSTDYAINEKMPRSAASLVYEQIVNDLKDAEVRLQSYYPATSRSRPNVWTATALLARVYLYQRDWQNASMLATEVINSGIYNIVSDLNSVFTSTSNEIVWQIISDNTNSAEAFLFIPFAATVKPNYACTDYLLNNFETGDLRKTSWIDSNTVSSQTYYYPFKFKVSAFTPITESNVVLRLAEQYLIRAEARAMQNDISGAQSDLNMIRTRAGLAATAASTQADLLLAIEHERQAELFAEWGHRWLDLKRTNRANLILGSTKFPNWQSEDTLYPIPLSQIQINVFLTQNPGY